MLIPSITSDYKVIRRPRSREGISGDVRDKELLEVPPRDTARSSRSICKIAHLGRGCLRALPCQLEMIQGPSQAVLDIARMC